MKLKKSILSSSTRLGLFNGFDCPEVIRKIFVEHVRIWDCEVSFESPIGTPGIADDEPLLRVVVAHCKNGMTAKVLFAGFGHRHFAGFSDGLAFETFVNRNSKNKGEA